MKSFFTSRTTPSESQEAEAPTAGFSRRQFLTGLGAFTLAVNFSGHIALAEALEEGAFTFEPNAFIRVDEKGHVTVVSSYLEMGQGTFTGLATIAAEEMDLTPEQISVVGSPADVERYLNPILSAHFKMQVTGGSTSMAGAWKVLRKAAVSARMMLLHAAANQWKVPVSELSVKDGVIRHSSGKQASYGAFVNAASRLSLPDEASLVYKKSSEYTRIGKANGMARIDIPEKVNGKAIFTQDLKLPDMLVAVIVHSPRKFTRIASVDASKAKAIKGVEAVLEIPGDNGVQGGVAVLAKNTWIAKKGCEALAIKWDENTGSRESSDALFTDYKARAATSGLEVQKKGEPLDEAPEGGQVIDAVYEFPYLAHSPMEPMNAVIHLKEHTCHMWNGEQFHSGDQAAIAKEVGMSPKQVQITQLYAGGSFGRRAGVTCDYVREAARIAVAARKQGITVPIKLVWFRENDMQGMSYRPMTVHNTRLVLDADGNLASMRWRVVGQSFFHTPPNKVDDPLMEGSHDLPYAIPNVLVEQHIVEGAVTVSWLRSVGHTHTGVVAETLIDDAARAAKQDPYEYRRKLLANSPRFLAVLDLVAEKSGWKTPLAKGKAGEQRARGIAIVESFNTVVAEVVEVTLRKDGTYRLDKVYCAADCGQVINPVNLVSQVEGGVGFGLSFLRQEITLKDGQIQQGNFNTYPVLRINEAPEVEVFTVASTNPPTGIGEPGVPPLVPAVLNALASLTGKPIRKLPLGYRV